MTTTTADIKALGGHLAPGAFKVWACLYRNGGGMTIDQIARKLKLNYMTVYLRLNGCMQHGYVTREMGKPATYFAVVPD
jgi:predicted DNA-binding transcriptional regulator